MNGVGGFSPDGESMQPWMEKGKPGKFASGGYAMPASIHADRPNQGNTSP